MVDKGKKSTKSLQRKILVNEGSGFNIDENITIKGSDLLEIQSTL